MTGLLLLAAAVTAGAQTGFGSHPVGSSATVAVRVRASKAGSVSQVRVLTTGNAGLDYTAGTGTTCLNVTLSAGQQCTQQVIFTPAVPGQRMGAVVLLDGSMQVLGESLLQGVGLGGLAVFSPGNMITVAGNGQWNLVNDGFQALQADLDLPSSVAIDAAENLYIADSEHNRIRRVDAASQVISTIAGNGSSSYFGDGGPATQAALNSPSSLSLDGAGNLYVADTGNNVVRKVDAQTGIITTVAGSGKSGYSGDNGPALAANLSGPWGVTAGMFGNLYIADTSNNVIREVDANGIITTVAGNGFKNPDGSGTFAGDGGPAASASLNRPYAVAFDTAGNMYIPDSNNNRIRVVNSAGLISTYAGSGVAGFSGDAGSPAAAQLSSPSGVLVDASQNIYIADTQNNAIRKVNVHAGVITTLVQSQVGKTLDSGALVNVQLYAPLGLAIDGQGNVYVADYYDMRIREIQANVAAASFINTPVRVGEVSAPQKRWIENDGTDTLTLNTISAGSNASIDPATTSCAVSTPIYQDRSCSIGVEFAPSVQGNPVLGDIETDAASGNSPLHITLVGDATAANSTTTTVTSSVDPANVGQTVTFTAAVTTGANTGDLNGTVTFYDGANILQSGVHVDSFGRATYSTGTLSIGNHTITASYGADTRHSGSTSQSLAETIDEQTTTVLSSLSNPASMNATITLKAAVGIIAGNIPLDGSVAFYDGAALLAVVPLDSSHAASYTTSKLSNGNHIMTAAYSGDFNKYILPSTSDAFNQDVVADSSISLTSNSTPSTYGNAVTFSAVVTSAGNGNPSGEVDFLDGAVQLGSANLPGTGAPAQFSISSLLAGTHIIKAVYEGSASFASATSPALTQTVGPAQTTTLLATNPPAIAGKPVTITATVALVVGAGTPAGSVVFTDGATSLGMASLNAGGLATISPILSAGSHSILASYIGDLNDSSSKSVPLPISVALATTSVDIKSSSSIAEVLAPVTFAIVVSGNGTGPTGNVSIAVDGVSAGAAPLIAGNGSFTQSFEKTGNHTISVAYTGDANNAPSSLVAFTQAVNPIPSFIGLSSYTPAGTTGQIVLLASVTADHGPTPTGTVHFTAGSEALGSASLNASGVATFNPGLPTGNYVVTTTYDGDSLHSASTSEPVNISFTNTAGDFNITVNPPTISLRSSENTAIRISLASQNGFADTIGLGCLSLPANVSCHFANIDVPLKTGASTDVQLVIDTDALLGGGGTASSSRPGKSPSLAGVLAPTSILFGTILWFKRRRAAIALLPALVFFLAGTMSLSGCVSKFELNSATPGTYTIQIGGIGNASHISHYQNISLTITK